MALAETKYCIRCKAIKGHCNGNCVACRSRESSERLQAWNAQPVEKKLDNLRQRIEVLEQDRDGRY